MRLTPRQRQIVERLAQGGSYADIAQSLGIAERTVRQHVDDVAAKLPAAGCGHPRCRVLHAMPALLTQEAA